MKKIFSYLLKLYSKSEKDRFFIYKQLWESTTDCYSEQTYYGNVYNMNIEFIMSNPFINKQVFKEDADSIKMIKANLAESFNKALVYIKEEKINR